MLVRLRCRFEGRGGGRGSVRGRGARIVRGRCRLRGGFLTWMTSRSDLSGKLDNPVSLVEINVEGRRISD